jgi:hypothetical protein
MSLFGTTPTTGLGITGASEDEVLLLSRGRLRRDLTFAVLRNQRVLWGGCAFVFAGVSSVLILVARSKRCSMIPASDGGYTERGMTGEQTSMLQMRMGACCRGVATNEYLGASGVYWVYNRSHRPLFRKNSGRSAGSKVLGELTN